jgi:peptidyl-prolyl cis-trans isomerase B (cyclophilin B)
MIMKKIVLALFICVAGTLVVNAQSTKVLMKTDMGDLILMLYDDTPMHKENFIDLVKEKFYDGILFHRVIPSFMIQAGDPGYRVNEKGDRISGPKADQKIPAEFKTNHYHKKGALAAARTNNPKKESSGSQFYIVDGRKWTKEQLDAMDKNRKLKFTDEERKNYMEVGGFPGLDFEYTVFGELLSGIDVVEAIAKVERNETNKPVKNIRIISARIIQ